MRRKKIFPKFRFGKHKQTKLLGTYFTISGYLMIALLWWYIAFPDQRVLSSTFLFMYIIALVGWYGHIFETLGIKLFPAAILPPSNYKQLKEIFVVSIASIIGIVYVFPSLLPEMPTLSAFNIVDISPIYILVIWGWIIPFTEEKLFGGLMHATLIETFYEFKINRFKSIILGTLGISLLFTLYNQYIFAIPLSILAYYFVTRMFFSIVNLHYGSFTFSMFTHMGINSYLVCMLFNLSPLICALPLGITMLMFYYLPKTKRLV